MNEVENKIEVQETHNDVSEVAQNQNEDWSEYLIGFFTGLVLNVFSFYTLSFYNCKDKKREGMLWGCLCNFVILFVFSALFSSYASYLYRERNSRISENNLDNRKLKRLLSFSEFISGSILGHPVALKKQSQGILFNSTKKRNISLKNSKKRLSHKKKRVKDQ